MVSWVEALDPALVTITAVTVAELHHGVALMPAGARREALASVVEAWIELLRCAPLPFDAEAARWFAHVMAS